MLLNFSRVMNLDNIIFQNGRVSAKKSFEIIINKGNGKVQKKQAYA